MAHRDDDFQREIDAHLELEADCLEKTGLTRSEALAAARRAFGNRTLVSERRYESTRWLGAGLLPSGFRLALRRISTDRWAPAAVVSTLGVAIGASVAIFSLVNAVALTPLPFQEPDRLVWFSQVLKMNTSDEVTITPDYLDWRRLTRSFTGIAAFNPQDRQYTTEGRARRWAGVRASSELLPVLGVQPALGRNFTHEEDLRGAPGVALLTHGLWVREFGSDPAVIGRKITLDDQAFEVIAVLPAEFRFPANHPVEVITPLAKDEATELKRGDRISIVRNVAGRLREGVTIQAARSELLALQASLTQLPWKPKIDIVMMPLAERLLREPRRAGYALLGATLFLLLIACANTANLLLAQGARRARETAVRAAIGGSRAALMSHVLIEAAILALAACALGVVLAWASQSVLLALIPRVGFETGPLRVNVPVLGFALLLAVVSVAVSAVGPSWRLSRTDPAEVMKRGASTHTGSLRTRRLLLAIASVEIALTFVLLSGAALLMRYFLEIRYGQLGFVPDRLIVASFTPRSKDTPFRLLEALRALPGIEGAALGESAAMPPGRPSFENSFGVEGRPDPPPGSRPVARFQQISGDYFTLLGIRVLEGRAPTTPGPEKPVVISRALARRLFRNESPIGQRIGSPHGWRTITGVVDDARTAGLDERPGPLVYVPAEVSRGLTDSAVVFRTSIPFEFAAAEVRSVVSAIDSRQSITSIARMKERLDEAAGQPRFVSILATVFASIALLLGVSGIYSVMSCCARWRSRELAVRAVYGATPADLRRAVIAPGFGATLAGLAAGAGSAAGLAPLLGGLVRGAPIDGPPVFAAVAFILAAAALAGCWIPARRVSRPDLSATLRDA